MTNVGSAAAPGLPSAPPAAPPRRRDRRPPPTPAALRRRLEDAAERIIAALDQLDGFDEDDEDDGTAEPYLSAPDRIMQVWNGCGDDREIEADEEPSLAAPETHPNAPSFLCAPGTYRGDGSQTRWARGHYDDREDEHDGREPSEDAEPSLAAIETSPSAEPRCRRRTRQSEDGDQRRWAAGSLDDTEGDDNCDDEGSLGAPEGYRGTLWNSSPAGSTDEAEADVDAGIDDDRGLDDDWFGGPDAELSLGWSADVDQRNPTASDEKERSLGSCNNVSQLAWGASGNQDEEGPATGGPTETSAIVEGLDGARSVLRHVGDPLEGMRVIHTAMQAGAVVRQLHFKQIRRVSMHANVTPVVGQWR